MLKSLLCGKFIDMEQLIAQNEMFFLLVTLLWVLPWKGYALWKAAQRADKVWYVALLLVQTLGLLEIIYVFYFADRPRKKEKSEESEK